MKNMPWNSPINLQKFIPCKQCVARQWLDNETLKGQMTRSLHRINGCPLVLACVNLRTTQSLVNWSRKTSAVEVILPGGYYPPPPSHERDIKKKKKFQEILETRFRENLTVRLIAWFVDQFSRLLSFSRVMEIQKKEKKKKTIIPTHKSKLR